MMAMANRLDGGFVIIGIGDDKETGAIRRHDPVGIFESDAATWDRDDLANEVRNFCVPPVEFGTDVQLVDNKLFVVIDVSPFRESPIFAAKDGHNKDGKHILKDGTLYVRSIHKPESVAISSSVEMRALLDPGVLRRLQQHHAMATASGQLPQSAQSSREKFEAEREEGFGSQDPLVETIKTRCFWRVTIRPEEYVKNRLRFTDLRGIVDSSSVALRGWNFPHIEYENLSEIRGTGWWGQFVSWKHFREVWRIFRSGQFEFIGGLHEDWAIPEEFVDSQAGKFPFWGAMYRMLEVYTFASNLAGSNAGAPRMHVEIEIFNINGRQLYQDNPRKTGLRTYPGPPEYNYPVDSDEYIDRDLLLADPQQLAAEATSDLLGAFAFNVPSDGVKIWQAEL